MPVKILLVDDTPLGLEMLDDQFRNTYTTLLASSGKESIELARQHPDIATVVMDIRMAGIDGTDAAREIRKLIPDTPIIFHTAYPGDYDEDEINDKEKPFDYIEKGGPVSRLTRSVRNAVENYQLKKTANIIDYAETAYGLIGRSRVMRDIYCLIRRVADSDDKVLVYGETGTGKELVARAIHYNSQRKDCRFRVFNCNHRSPDMVDSELFGHVRGAFTGAVADRVGLFELADKGTVFLDEIGDLDITTQGKLLRVLESGEYCPVGDSEERFTDARLICATNKDLEILVRDKSFREDLYYRLKGIIIKMPPLRERRDDIPLLIEKFMNRITLEQGLAPKVFESRALELLIAHDWPGNVRDLLDTVRSLITIVDSDIIFAEDVEKFLGNNGYVINGENVSLKDRLLESRKNIIIEALVKTNNNLAAAAKLLQVDRSNFSKMIKAHNIDLGKINLTQTLE